MLNELNVREFSDLYKLKKEDLMTLDGFGELKAQNLINAIEKSKDVALSVSCTRLE